MKLFNLKVNFEVVIIRTMLWIVIFQRNLIIRFYLLITNFNNLYNY